MKEWWAYLNRLRIRSRVVHPDPFMIWDRREQAFVTFLQRTNSLETETLVEGQISLVVQPWLMTAVPWFTIALALGLTMRGRKVRLIWDDTDFGPAHEDQGHQQNSLLRVLLRLPRSIEYVRLTDIVPTSPLIVTESEMQQLVGNNVKWFYRSEIVPPESVEYQAAVELSLRRTAGHIQAFLQQHKPEYLVVAGGMYSSSGLFVHIGQKLGIRVVSFDSGSGLLFVCSNGVAAHFADIPRGLDLLPTQDGWVIAEAQAELSRRRRGDLGQDTFVYQATGPREEQAPFDLLLVLSISNDTAALGRHHVFKDQTEWMLETAAWVLNHSDGTIVIRRHPAERIAGFGTAEDYEQSLVDLFGQHSQIRFVPPDAQVNTYDLVNQARVVLTYTSTVGIEAAASGKPVVTEGANCYADLGFVWGAKTREEYFDLLGRAMAGELEVNEEKREDAWRCYYLSQCCNFLYTSFTPIPEDFDKWVLMYPRDLFSSPEVSDVLEAIDTNTPLSIIRHLRRKRERDWGEHPKGVRQVG